MAKKLGTLKVKRFFLGTDSGGRGTEVTSSAAELNALDGNSVVLADVTATAAELNILDGVTADKDELNLVDGCTATTDELNLVDGAWASITTTPTDNADGTAVAQFEFKDAAGADMAAVCVGQFYVSESATGVTVDAADTSVVVSGNGVITIVDTGAAKYYNYVTSISGKLGITITAADDDYYFGFQHPAKGTLVLSDAVTLSGN